MKNSSSGASASGSKAKAKSLVSLINYIYNIVQYTYILYILGEK